MRLHVTARSFQGSEPFPTSPVLGEEAANPWAFERLSKCPPTFSHFPDQRGQRCRGQGRDGRAQGVTRARPAARPAAGPRQGPPCLEPRVQTCAATP